MAHACMLGPLGAITLFEEDGALVCLKWGLPAAGSSANDGTPLLREAIAQLTRYFDGEPCAFTLPLAPAATPFQQRVRAAMLAIPYGSVASYAELARETSSAPRAVGQACARNPLAIVVPCHRVLAARGRPGGYSGGNGLATKRALLRLEGYALAEDREVVAS